MKRAGYYGRPIVKPPAWTDLIPVYFFAGGLSGTAATLGFAERAAKNDRLARTMLLGAALGTGVSAFCLIADLKKPARFLNMLRVFKPTSPMSIGVYVFSVFGSSATIAAISELSGIARPAGRFFELIAALTGPLMSVYTAVLIGDTVIPAWHLPRSAMPAVFASTSATSAGAWGLLFSSARANESARRLAIAGGVATVASLQALHHEIGTAQDEAYKKGEAGLLAQAARALNLTGTICAIFARKSDALSKTAGALLLAGGLAERFAVYRAGCASASDPKYVMEAQRVTTQASSRA